MSRKASQRSIRAQWRRRKTNFDDLLISSFFPRLIQWHIAKENEQKEIVARRIDESIDWFFSTILIVCFCSSDEDENEMSLEQNPKSNRSFIIANKKKSVIEGERWKGTWSSESRRSTSVSSLLTTNNKEEERTIVAKHHLKMNRNVSFIHR